MGDRIIRGCSVAVVGGAGFLGSHLVNHLIDDRGCDVLVLDNLVTGRREFIHPRARFEHADITASETRMRGLFKRYGCRFVFNYAAIPYIPVSFARPLYALQVNTVGALQVINAAHEAGCVQGILQVSSAELYGGSVEPPTNPLPGVMSDLSGKISEVYPVAPHSSYGAAKAAIDYFVQCRWKEAETPAIALRQFNCVGERETHPYVVPEIISQLAPQIYSDRMPTEYEAPAKPNGVVRLGNNSFRDFLYAGDAVRIAVDLLERGAFGEVYNLGSEEGVKIYELAKRIGRVMGFRDVTVEEDEARKRPWEIWHLQSDNSKLWEVVPRRPITTLDTALRLTVEDYRRNDCQWCWEPK